jgi:GSH-dependent disulfide-bond oxidoreductase
MLELYTYGTSNGQRASVMLEECGQQYKAIKVDLERGEQKTPNFLRINPAGQIPVLVDLSRAGGKPIVICQSGAIILHLAERTGRLLRRPVGSCSSSVR